MMWGTLKFRVGSKTGQSCGDLDISRTVTLPTKSFQFEPHCFAEQLHTKSLIKSIFCKNTEPSGQHLPIPGGLGALGGSCSVHIAFVTSSDPLELNREHRECSKSPQLHFTTSKSFSPCTFPLQTNRFCIKKWCLDVPLTLQFCQQVLLEPLLG